MHLRLPHPRPDHGLTRSEWLWTLLLLFVIVATIVGTLDSEVEKGNRRMAGDHLSYLASQLYLGLEDRAPGQPADLPLPMLGPGLPPTELPVGEQNPTQLQKWMPEDGYLPVDPWGRSYVLMLGEADGMEAIFVVSAGEDGQLPEQVDLSTELAARVHWPVNG